jgi:hypothetical protein
VLTFCNTSGIDIAVESIDVLIFSSLAPLLVISTIDREFGVGNLGMDGTFEAMVVSKKLAIGTGNAVHEFGSGNCSTNARPDIPSQ